MSVETELVAAQRNMLILAYSVAKPRGLDTVLDTKKKNKPAGGEPASAHLESADKPRRFGRGRRPSPRRTAIGGSPFLCQSLMIWRSHGASNPSAQVTITASLRAPRCPWGVARGIPSLSGRPLLYPHLAGWRGCDSAFSRREPCGFPPIHAWA